MRISRSRQFRINLSVPCKEWTGHRNKKSGHGQRWDKVQRCVRGAHVMAWEEAHGRPVPPGKLVRHACDNPPCIEPRHLQLGTHKDNRADLVDRHPERVVPPPRRYNEQHGRHKLTDEQVRAIRAAYTGVRGQKAALAREYGVSATWIGQLLDGRWRHANLEIPAVPN